MKVEPRRSKFKKVTSQYNKDNVLDIIDIEDTLSKNRFIPKTSEDKFIYSKYLQQSNQSSSLLLPSSLSSIPSSINDISSDIIDFPSLNANKFHINFEEIRLEYSNGYSIRLVDVYYPIQIIGEGSYGLVIGAIHRKTMRKEAIKIIDKHNLSETEKDTLNNEVKILNSLSHPKILQINEVLDTNDYFFIFMELIEGGTLRDLIINRYQTANEDHLFRDSECSEIMNNLLEALNYLQMKKVIHRDIKPENIMFKVKDDFSSITLCDFGIACKLTNTSPSATGKCGTTLYMAPEVIEGRRYDHLIDSWSAGIVLYILVSGGEHPLYNKTMSQADYEKELLKKNQINFPEHIPLLARNLFFKLCKYEPFYRFEPFKALKHPWITRSNKSQIPLTIVEEYEIKGKIKEFKSMLSATLFFDLYKSIYQLQLKPKDKVKDREQDKDNDNEKGNYNKDKGRVKEREGNKDILSRKVNSIMGMTQLNTTRAPKCYSLKTKRLPKLNEVKREQYQPKKYFLSRNTKISITLNQSSGDNSLLSTSSNPKDKHKKRHFYLKTDVNNYNCERKMKK